MKNLSDQSHNRRAVLGVIMFLSLVTLSIAADYPPPDFALNSGKIGGPVDSPTGDFKIEQWYSTKPTHAGMLSWQTWIVSKDGQGVRLPEAPLPTEYSSMGDTGGTGGSSDFSVSTDGHLIFRSGKIVRGIGGAYLYQRENGLNFKLLVPDLGAQACAFFSQTTKQNWKYGMGIVELVSWNSDGNLVLTVRGTLATGTVMGWRCIYSLKSGQFSVDSDSASSPPKAVTGQVTIPISASVIFVISITDPQWATCRDALPALSLDPKIWADLAATLSRHDLEMRLHAEITSAYARGVKKNRAVEAPLFVEIQKADAAAQAPDATPEEKQAAIDVRRRDGAILEQRGQAVRALALLAFAMAKDIETETHATVSN